MKAFKLVGLRKMEMVEVAMPEIERDDDVLLKLAVVGVCGSDVHYYETGRIGSQVITFPFTVGHECSAVVVKTGKGVRHFKAGDEVAVDPAMVCHGCDQCKAGRENTCRKLRFLGTPPQEGCLSEYIVMPEDSLYGTSGKISLVQAAVCEPLSIGVYAVKQAGLARNADIAILGSGPIGLSVLLAAKAAGARNVYVTDLLKERLAIAMQTGATWTGNPEECDVVKSITERAAAGIDAVFECAGEQDAIDEGIEVLKPGGKMILVGIPRVERVSFAIDKLRRKELTVVNIRRQNKCVQEAIDLVAAGKINVDFMVTHRFKFEAMREAMELVAGYRDGVLKAIIEFS